MENIIVDELVAVQQNIRKLEKQLEEKPIVVDRYQAGHELVRSQKQRDKLLDELAYLHTFKKAWTQMVIRETLNASERRD
jgi:predicted DNA-binding protein YlxM (UPF0122 family)